MFKKLTNIILLMFLRKKITKTYLGVIFELNVIIYAIKR